MRRLPSPATESNPERSPWGSARFRADADEERFTDADILAILRAAEEGARVADLCAAEGIAVSTYYVWKVKYGGLPAPRMRSLRLRQRRNGRTTLAGMALVVAALGAGYRLSVPRKAGPVQQLLAAPHDSVVQPLPRPDAGGSPAADVGPQPVPPDGDGPQETDVAQPVATTAGDPQATADDIEMMDPIGYSVQVAALPDLGEARALLRQLAAGGYPAYLTRKDVNQLQLYRVRVGPLESPREAEEVVRRLELEGHQRPWVTK